MAKILRVGLTGGSGCGKTRVTGMLERFGAVVLDADVVGRQLLEPGQVAFSQVVAGFGEAILGADGCIDRGRLSAIVFADPDQRAQLEAIVHPLILEEEERRLAELRTGDEDRILITDAALLVESGAYKRYDALVVVYCSRDTQVQRLIDAKGLTREEAERRLQAQASTPDKLQHAHFSLDTERPLEETLREVDTLYRSLVRRLKSKPVAG